MSLSTWVTVTIFGSLIAMSFAVSNGNKDHSKLTYLKYVTPQTKDLCEKEAREARYKMSLFGAAGSQLMALEECVISLEPEAVEKGRKEATFW